MSIDASQQTNSAWIFQKIQRAHISFQSTEQDRIFKSGAKLFGQTITGPGFAIAGLIMGLVTGFFASILFIPAYFKETLNQKYEMLKVQSIGSFKASVVALGGIFGRLSIPQPPQELVNIDEELVTPLVVTDEKPNKNKSEVSNEKANTDTVSGPLFAVSIGLLISSVIVIAHRVFTIMQPQAIEVVCHCIP